MESIALANHQVLDDDEPVSMHESNDTGAPRPAARRQRNAHAVARDVGRCEPFGNALPRSARTQPFEAPQAQGPLRMQEREIQDISVRNSQPREM